MKKTITKVICLCLTFSLISTFFTGCKKKSDNDSSSTDSDYAIESSNQTTSITESENTNESKTGSSNASTAVSSNSSKSSQNSSVKIPDNMNVTGFPIAKKQVTLKIMVNTSSSQPDFSKVKMFQEYEKMTNVKIEWINIPAGNTRTKVMMAFASGDMPDAFLKCGSILTNSTQYSFAKDKKLFNMNSDGRLKTFAPNFYKFYSENTDVKKAMTFASDAVYSFPQGVDCIPNKVAGKLFINKKWLNKAGKSLPTTTNELYSVLKSFSENDMNGNGKKDEIPLSAPNYNYITYMLYGAFGLGNRGVHSNYVDIDESSGKTRFIQSSNEYKKYLEYCNKLYSEKLLDNNIFTMSESQYIAKQAGDKVGAFCYTNLGSLPKEISNDFVGIEKGLKGPDGYDFWYPVRSKLHSTGAFVITSSCKNPEIAMRWADYFFSDEGNLLYNYGKEGVSHKKNADGTYDFVDSVYTAINNGLSFDAAVSTHVAVGGSNPIVTKDAYFYGAEMQPIPKKAANNMVSYFPKEIWPTFVFTPKESSTLSSVSVELETYADKMAASFITGKESLSSWSTYTSKLKSMGVNTMLSIYQSAYQRYKS